MTVFEKKNRVVTLWAPFGIQPENDLCEQMRQQKTPAGEIPVFGVGLTRSSTGTQNCLRLRLYNETVLDAK